MPISSPTEIYFPTIFPASDRSDRSGPVKGVTRFIRTTPLIIPSSSQREKAITLAKILLRNRYTTVVVVKIKKALYRKNQRTAGHIPPGFHRRMPGNSLDHKIQKAAAQCLQRH